MPRLPLPRRPTDLADAAEVLIPGQPRTGRVAMSPDLRIPPRWDYRTGPTPVQRLVHLPPVVRPIRRRTLHRVVHLTQQRGDHLRIGHARLTHHRRLDLVGLG